MIVSYFLGSSGRSLLAADVADDAGFRSIRPIAAGNQGRRCLLADQASDAYVKLVEKLRPSTTVNGWRSLARPGPVCGHRGYYSDNHRDDSIPRLHHSAFNENVI